MRAKLIPGFEDMKKNAIASGALGCSIAGSGPSVFAWSTSESIANDVGKTMQSVCDYHGMNSDVYVSKINEQGAEFCEV